MTFTALFAGARRPGLLASTLMAATLMLCAAPGHAQREPNWDTQRWVGTWGTAPAGPPPAAQLMTFNNQTLRLIVHTSIAGSRVRIRVSNEFGTTALRIGAAHIGLRGAGGEVTAGSDRTLTFSGFTAITVPPGAPVLSDPVDLDVPALADLAVSLYLPEQVQAVTIHNLAFQTNYVSLPGDFTGAATFPTERTITSWPFLTEVDVSGAEAGAAIVALGNSITDGVRTAVDANNRWPDWLARRLQTVRGNALGRLGVVNRGISGNRLLRNPFMPSLAGRAALERFDRDVNATAGVRYLIVLLGINDIGAPGTASTPPDQAVTADDLIAGYRQLIARAHVKGIAIYGATMTPFEGTANPGYYTPEKELIREAVNNWIRSSDEFDAVIDFDRATRDPAHPTRFLPAFDSGDHLHPNDLGMQAMGNAIPLELFSGRPLVRAAAVPNQEESTSK